MEVQEMIPQFADVIKEDFAITGLTLATVFTGALLIFLIIYLIGVFI